MDFQPVRMFGKHRLAQNAEKNNVSFLAVSGGFYFPANPLNPHVIAMQPLAS